MPYDERVLPHETPSPSCSPLYVCIVILWLLSNEVHCFPFSVGLRCVSLWHAEGYDDLSIRIFRAGNISYFMDFKNLKAIVD